jgi:hypothetical protein
MQTSLESLGDSLYESLCSVHKPVSLSADAVELCRLLTQTLIAGINLFWPSVVEKTELIMRELTFFENLHARENVGNGASGFVSTSESNTDAVLLPGRTTMRDDTDSSNSNSSGNVKGSDVGIENHLAGLDARALLVAGMLAKSSTDLLASNFQVHHNAVRPLLPKLFEFVGTLCKSSLREAGGDAAGNSSIQVPEGVYTVSGSNLEQVVPI